MAVLALRPILTRSTLTWHLSEVPRVIFLFFILPKIGLRGTKTATVVKLRGRKLLLSLKTILQYDKIMRDFALYLPQENFILEI